MKVYSKTNYLKNKDLIFKRHKNWVSRNQEKVRLNDAKHRKKSIGNLSGRYVCSLILKGTTLKTSQIPQCLIEAKRAQIKLCRKLKQIKEQNDKH
jgi:hypothetical protein